MSMMTPMALVLMIAGLASPPAARSFSLIGSADLTTQPENFYSFDGSVITWKLDQTFLTLFPSIDLHNQVRLAFQEWSIATGSAARRNSPRYHWVRNTEGARFLTDLRSVVTHELGHVLGSQHPDASWFNNNLHKNFRYQNSQLVAAPPLGGEVMNEGNKPNTLPNSKPPKGLGNGEYWRTLSKDELVLLDYVYDRQITFKEVFGNAPAQISVTAYNNPASTALGQGGPDVFPLRVPNDESKGRRIVASSLTVNAGKNLGIDQSTHSWHVKNKTDKRLSSLTIRTEGTNTRQPLAVYFGSVKGNFSEYAPADVMAGPYAFENVGHVFSRKPGKYVEKKTFFDVGLKQDVWDWYVTVASAVAKNGDILPISLMTYVPFYQVQAPSQNQTAGAAAPTGGEIDPLEVGEAPTVLARGIRIINSDQPTMLSEFAIAPVGKMVNARNVNVRTWEKLRREGRVEKMRFEPRMMEAGEELYVLFEGDPGALPPEVIAAGNYMVFDHPRLLDRKFIAAASSEDEEFAVQTLGLINDEPITSKPVRAER